MYHIRLAKALSYSGIVSATKKNPDVFVEDKATADAAVATGYFVHVGQQNGGHNEQPMEEPGESEAPDYEALAKQTKTELAKYAQEHSISVEGCKTKADILQAISVAYGGSYTMMELQHEGGKPGDGEE